MSRRKRIAHFAGAAGAVSDRVNVEKFIVQPKYDGEYCEIETDWKGHICELRSKTGRVIRTEEARSLVGVLAGYPHSVLCGELMAHTEAGKAHTARLGYSVAYLFDALIIGEERMHNAPYHQRLDKLNSMHADVQARVANKREWYEDENKRARDFHGRFTARTPACFRRTPVVPSVYNVNGVDRLWREYVLKGGGEGLVFCDPHAHLGKRSSKLKKKPMMTIDAVVVGHDDRYADVEYLDISALAEGAPVTQCPKKRFTLTCTQKRWEVRLGDVLEIGFQGFNVASGLPKFPRVLRKRDDLL